MSENIPSHPYISYMTNEKLQGEGKFHSKNYRFEMTRCHAKMHFKSVPQRLDFVMAKAISNIYTLDCSCKCPCMVAHSNTASFLIKTTLYETNNFLFSKKYWKLGKMNARFWRNIQNQGKVLWTVFEISLMSTFIFI